MIAASAVNQALPFLVFGAFMLVFMVQARRRGQSVREYLDARNRETFTNRRPGWWKIPTAISALVWIAFWIASGFNLLALVFLPVVVLWPLGTMALRAYYRRC